jgi:hypothetical protein
MRKFRVEFVEGSSNITIENLAEKTKISMGIPRVVGKENLLQTIGEVTIALKQSSNMQEGDELIGYFVDDPTPNW